MDRTTSRTYTANINGLHISQYDLNLIKQDALQRLVDEQGCDVPRAWVNAVLAYLNKNSLLDLSSTLLNTKLTKD